MANKSTAIGLSRDLAHMNSKIYTKARQIHVEIWSFRECIVSKESKNH